jgi:chromosome segregation ATPase
MRQPMTVLASGIAVAAIATGCAGNRTLEQQDLTYLSRAEASIEQAERSGAQRYASAELNDAREKLEAARDAQRREDLDIAERLAVQAQLDAQLAEATAGNQQMQTAVQELRDSLETLREEIQRGER